MKFIRATLLTIIAISLLVTNVSSAYACPMQMQHNQKVDNKNKCHTQKKAEEKSSHLKVCDSCACMHCNQVTLLNINFKQHNSTISTKLSHIEKSFFDFSESLRSPPPKILS